MVVEWRVFRLATFFPCVGRSGLSPDPRASGIQTNLSLTSMATAVRDEAIDRWRTFADRLEPQFEQRLTYVRSVLHRGLDVWELESLVVSSSFSRVLEPL